MLRREGAAGHDVIVFSATTQFSPAVTLSFYFGRFFPTANSAVRQFSWSTPYYHVHQLSENRPLMEGLAYEGPYRWNVDLRATFGTLPQEVASAIQGVAFPFFERFIDLETARAGIVSRDSWCIGAEGPFWRSLLAMDLALDDVDHFRQWGRSLDPFSRRQANDALVLLGVPTIDSPGT
jgi:hypothetical protein